MLMSVFVLAHVHVHAHAFVCGHAYAMYIDRDGVEVDADGDVNARAPYCFWLFYIFVCISRDSMPAATRITRVGASQGMERMGKGVCSSLELLLGLHVCPRFTPPP